MTAEEKINFADYFSEEQIAEYSWLSELEEADHQARLAAEASETKRKA